MKIQLKSLLSIFVCAAMLAGCSESKEEMEPTPPTPDPDPVEKTEEELLDIPDLENKNIKGVVYCGNKPLSGVAVSDGISVVTTDANGRYYLNSQKKMGYVFVSIPSGYMVTMENTVYPKMYQRLTADTQTMEQINFKLTEKPGDNYVIMYLADMHLAGRNQDEEHYQNWFMTDIRKLIKDYNAQGRDVYCMTLGDESWNTYWYAADIPAPFTLTNVKPYLEMLNLPVFNTMGNHDHDPKQSEDFPSEDFWRRELGPTYYSYNIGKVHFIVLDNVYYTNPTGTLSDNCYDYRVTIDQMAWLKADLATITDKSTPIHVLTHVPLHEKPKLNASGNPKYSYMMEDGKTFANTFAEFSNVKLFTGHTHVNYTIQDTNNPNLLEYNVASVCATWWWTGKNEYPGNHICRDGSVGGYRVVEVNGKNMTTYYKSIGYDANYQFRTYDCNECRITAPKYCPNSNNAAIAKEITALTGASGATNTDGSNWHIANNNNEVLINVFAYDPRWKVEVSEGGKQLEVTRENVFDPLHIISAMCYRLQNNGKISATFKPALSSHFFRVKASSPTSTLEIRVTDQDGKVYTETMTRPKALTTTMR